MYLAATPWALPLSALAGLVLLLVAGPVAARMRVPAWLVLGTGLSWAVFVAVTATPSEMPWVRTDAGLGETALLSLDWQPIAWAALTEISERSLNVWLAVPLGFFSVMLALRRGSPVPVLPAALAPVAVETLQALVPQLGRAGFLLADAALNATGLLLGAAAALGLSLLWAVLTAPLRRAVRSRHPLPAQDRRPQDRRPQDRRPQDRRPQDRRPQERRPQERRPRGGSPGGTRVRSEAS